MPLFRRPKKMGDMEKMPVRRLVQGSGDEGSGKESPPSTEKLSPMDSPAPKGSSNSKGKSPSEEKPSLNEKPAPDGSERANEGDISLKEDIKWNIDTIRSICGPENKDIIIRNFKIGMKPAIEGAVFFVEGLADRQTINLSIMQPLMLLSRIEESSERAPYGIITKENAVEKIMNYILPTNQAGAVKKIDDVIKRVMTGECCILIDGVAEAIIVEVKGWEHRSISEPDTEVAIRGPREGFTETLRVNTALIRRRIRTPKLRFKAIEVGRISKTDVAVAYIEGLTDRRLVDDVINRIEAIDTDIITESGMIEQFIEDSPFSLFPQLRYTERPDKVTAALSEGQVAILVDGSPMALIAPSTGVDILHSAEDYYDRFIIGSFLRLLRGMAVVISLIFPAFYVAVTTFHQEMLPTDLVLAFAASREAVPFPVFVEAILMEGALELIREAGIRLPSPVGQTVGIVGALLLGEAAVSANIVSPIMVIVVAITGLASFASPYYPAGLAIRLLRFPLMILAAIQGFYGLTAGIILIVLHASALKSFGIPYLSPFFAEPYSFKDLIVRLPTWFMTNRPFYTAPQDPVRQKRRIRGNWQAEADKDSVKGEEDGAESGKDNAAAGKDSMGTGKNGIKAGKERSRKGDDADE